MLDLSQRRISLCSNLCHLESCGELLAMLRGRSHKTALLISPSTWLVNISSRASKLLMPDPDCSFFQQLRTLANSRSFVFRLIGVGRIDHVKRGKQLAALLIAERFVVDL